MSQCRHRRSFNAPIWTRRWNWIAVSSPNTNTDRHLISLRHHPYAFADTNYFFISLFSSHTLTHTHTHTDLSLLYNPLIYSNTFFWPSTFLLPYQNAAAAAAVGIVGAPVSPGLASMRDYTLTPEKEEVAEIDEDEPLNLSTRPRSPTPNTPPSASNASNTMATSHHNQSRSSHPLIWSPASFCQKESTNCQPSRAETRRLTSNVKSEHTDSSHEDLRHHQTTSATTKTQAELLANFSAVAAAAAAAAAAAQNDDGQQPPPILSAFNKKVAGYCADSIKRDFYCADSISSSSSSSLSSSSRIKPEIDYPMSLTQAAAAAAAAVQVANTTDFFTHLHQKQNEFDLIAKNHLDLFTRNNNHHHNNNHINNNNNNNKNNINNNIDNENANHHHIGVNGVGGGGGGASSGGGGSENEAPKNSSSRNDDRKREQRYFQVSTIQFNLHIFWHGRKGRSGGLHGARFMDSSVVHRDHNIYVNVSYHLFYFRIDKLNKICAVHDPINTHPSTPSISRPLTQFFTFEWILASSMSYLFISINFLWHAIEENDKCPLATRISHLFVPICKPLHQPNLLINGENNAIRVLYCVNYWMTFSTQARLNGGGEGRKCCSIQSILVRRRSNCLFYSFCFFGQTRNYRINFTLFCFVFFLSGSIPFVPVLAQFM